MDWQIITALASSTIATCAIFISVWQGIEMRKHNRISVKPHLTTWLNNRHSEGVYEFYLVNNGIGPAFIQSFTVEINSVQIEGNKTELLHIALKQLFPGSAYAATVSHVAKGYAMGAKEEICLINVKFDKDKMPTKEEINDSFNKADLLITYESAYKESVDLSTKEENLEKG